MPNAPRIPPGQRAAAQESLNGGTPTSWPPEEPVARIYHQDNYTPTATHRRVFGPLARFDPHHPKQGPAEDPDARTVSYLAENIETSVCEGVPRVPYPSLCPQWRLALLAPADVHVVLQDFVKESATSLGAPDDLGDGQWDYQDTQEWARGIYEYRPAGAAVAGIRYWSRRRRNLDGSRLGVNCVIWDTAPPLDAFPGGFSTDTEEVSLHTVWPRVLEAAISIGVYPDRIGRDACFKCREASS